MPSITALVACEARGEGACAGSGDVLRRSRNGATAGGTAGSRKSFDTRRIGVYTPNSKIGDSFQGSTRVRPAGAQMSNTGRYTIQQRMGQLAQEGSSCVSFNIRKAARAVTQLYDERLRPFGLRSTQLSILGKTLILEPVTVTHLAKATMTD